VERDGTRRIAVLRRWRASIEGTGLPVPSQADLDRVGDAGTLWPPSVNRSVLEPWRGTIRHLLERVALGDPDPVATLPAHLRRPASASRDGGWSWASPPSPRPSPRPSPTPSPTPSPAPAPSPAPSPAPAATGTSADAVLDRMVQWRRQAIKDGVRGAAELRMGFLRSLARQGLRSEEEITGSLPGTLAHLAPALAAVMQGGPAPMDARQDARPSPRPDAPTEPAPAPRTDATAPGSGGIPAPGSGGIPAPESGGIPAPESGGIPAPEGPAVDDRLKGVRFTPFVDRGRSAPAGRLTVTASPTGGVDLGWDAPADDHDRDDAGDDTGEPRTGPAPVVIYRVVADDHQEPYGPDEEYADTVAVTVGRTATDERPCERGARYFSVWCHRGATEDEAARAEPELLATGMHVVPPRDVEVEYDHPRVVGRWRRLDGTDYVMVSRLRRDRGRHSEPEPDWDGYERLDEGFKDTRPEPGADYVYLVRAAVRSGGAATLSAPVACPLHILALHEAVTDLELVQREVKDERGRPKQVFDLSWTPPPAGRVRIYRTTDPSEGGLVGHEVGMAALEIQGLRAADQLRDAQGTEDGRAVMRDVPWPDDTHRVHFTPVTELDGRARVGPTRAASRLGTITELRCVERTAEQVITFAWPPGATAVWLYRGRSGTSENPVLGRREREFTRAQYENLGGIRVQLDRRGEAVHLEPVLYEGGVPKRGEVASLEYPGLVLLWYRVATRRRRDGRVDVEVTVQGERNDVAPPPFALMHNPHRLPLWWDDRDGSRLLPVVRLGGDGPDALIRPSTLAPGQTETWAAVVDHAEGFVRLCVAADAAAGGVVFALQDPPVGTLRLAAAGDATTAPLAAPPRRRRPWWRFWSRE
jgi:hypothetical protein